MGNFAQPPALNPETDEEQVWAPKDGSPTEIEGVVVERKTVTKRDGAEAELLRIETTAGTWTVWCTATMLRDCLEHFEPKAGDQVGIKYAGRKALKSGRTMDVYEMYNDGPPPRTLTAGIDITSGADAKVVALDDEPF